jgi:1-deoxy-D-xylulose-5-phosphate reductoisomerase
MVVNTQGEPTRRADELIGLCLLGSTGSIGQSTLEVVRSLGPERVRVVGLAAGQRVEALLDQAEEFQPTYVSCLEGAPASALAEGLAARGLDHIELRAGVEGQEAMVADPRCDTVLAAISGAAGLPAVLEAARQGRRLCLSNKESLVMAGPLVSALTQRHGGELLPVDSEHSALFQALQSGRIGEVKRLILTASGGPFRRWSKAQMAGASVAEALKHPTWSMGPNITIDSATLMNKTLELIEAFYLFPVSPEKIDVIVHPQSVIHSLVEYVDGSVIAQLGVPDMKVPIQYALTYPDRSPLETAPFNLAEIARLTFEPVDPERFPAIALAYRVMELGGAAGAVLNAANETSRQAFLDGETSFDQIVAVNTRVLEAWSRDRSNDRDAPTPAPDLRALLAADRWAREDARRCLTTTNC